MGPVLASICAAGSLALCLIGPGSGRPQLESRTLPNGLRAVAVHMPGAPLTAIDVWIRAGSAYERPGERGAAHVLEHLLFRGTPTRRAGEIDAAIERCGGILNAGTLRDAAHVWTPGVFPADLPEVLETLADAVQNPRLDERDLTPERRIILDELARRAHETSRIHMDTAFAQAYPDAPIGWPILGDSASISAVSRAAVAAFHARRYAPAACVVAVAGPWTCAESLDAIARAFGRWTSAPAVSDAEAADTAMPDPRAASFRPIVVGSARQIRVWRIPPAMQGRNADVALLLAALMEATMEEADPGPDRPTAEAADSAFGGLLMASYPPGNRAVEPALDALIGRLAQDGPRSGEVAAAARRVLGRQYYAAETPEGIAREVGRWALYGDMARPLNLADRLGAITDSEIQQFARTWLAVNGNPKHTP